MSYLRVALWAALALSLLGLGWTVNSWRVKAARLATVEQDLRAERDKRANAERARQEADDARTLASAQLEDFRERTEDEIDLLKAKVRKGGPVLVNNSAACAFGRDLVKLINDARNQIAVTE